MGVRRLRPGVLVRRGERVAVRHGRAVRLRELPIHYPPPRRDVVAHVLLHIQDRAVPFKRREALQNIIVLGTERRGGAGHVRANQGRQRVFRLRDGRPRRPERVVQIEGDGAAGRRLIQ